MHITTTEILAIRELDIIIRKSYGANLQECYANWALTQLSNGLSSNSLSILAGLTWKDNYFEADIFFLNALKELDIAIPPPQVSIKNFAIAVCKKILNEEISTEQGCKVLADIFIETSDNDYTYWYNLQNNDYRNYLTEEEYRRRFDKEVKKEAQSFLDAPQKKIV